MVNVQVFDDVFPEAERKLIWKYIENQQWHVYWKSTSFPGETYNFIPAKDKRWRNVDPVRFLPHMYMPRAAFASDEASLQERHPFLFSFWEKINNFLGNEFTITGCPEGIVTENKGDPSWVAPPTVDTTLEQGWRVYANAQPSETIKRSHGVHRDTIDLNDTTSYTLLYVANMEWYPSWFGECVYYPDDNNDITGDYQQFQSVLPSNQNRNFKIGWADDGKIVSPKPGRIILYDGRTLHTTRPTAMWALAPRKVIAFRIRKKG